MTLNTSIIDGALQETREQAILLAVEQKDLVSLRKWSAEPGGFGSDAVRRVVWPFLLGVTDEPPHTDQPITPVSTEPHHLDSDKSPSADLIDEIIDEPNSLQPTTSPLPSPTAEDEPTTHSDESQVKLDTDRSFVYYPLFLSPNEKDRLQGELNELIVTVLRKRKGLSYFQGYHDIISILYLTFFPYQNEERRYRSADLSSRPHSRSASTRSPMIPPLELGDEKTPLSGEAVEENIENGNVKDEGRHSGRRREEEKWRLLCRCCDALSLLRIRDGMGQGMGPVVGALRVLKRLLKAADPDLAALVHKVSPMPYFALSWILTLFSHDIDILSPVQRIFDFFLARNPGVVIYLGVAIILLKKKRLMELKDTLDDDPGIMHSHLALLPPLLADGSPAFLIQPKKLVPTNLAAATAAGPLDRTIYPEKATNPHAPIKLSELFQLTDTLMRRFPGEHKEIRVGEVMGPLSVVFTYEEGWEGRVRERREGFEEKSVEEKEEPVSPHAMMLEEAAKLVDEGLKDSDAVVVPPPPDSDEEQEDTWNARDRRRPRLSTPRSRRRDRVGKGLAVAVLCISVGIALYRLNNGRSVGVLGGWESTWRRWSHGGSRRIDAILSTYRPWLSAVGLADI